MLLKSVAVLTMFRCNLLRLYKSIRLKERIEYATINRRNYKRPIKN
ncbi:hypothetical protein EMIT079MI2_10563 [Bacillus sp. IT-79MI2]